MKKLRNLTLANIKNLADSLAKKYETKDVIVGLTGPLGAGKTAFAKAFAAHFGIKKIKSPTFIIGSIYPSKNRHIYHYDFYRLDDHKQLEHVGFQEAVNANRRVMLIEWVNKFPEIEKLCDLVLNFEIIDKNLRNVTIK